MGYYAANTSLLTTNWLTCIQVVNHDHVLEANLGYFINPFVMVMLAALVPDERLQPVQWVSVALATAGVARLTWQTGMLPWIISTPAFSFGFYGLLRETLPLGALERLALETLLLFSLVLIYLG